MDLLDRLERRFGRFAIRNLVLYVAVANAAVYLFDFAFTFSGGMSLSGMLALIPQRALEGEVWRAVTFIFVPGASSLPLLTLLQIYFIYFVGMFLQRSWSPFRLNVYYLVGMLAIIAVSFATGAPAVGSMLNTSLFLAFAAVAPELQILLFFFIPVKVKWLGWLTWAFLAYQFLAATDLGTRLSVVALVANYFLFFWRDIANRLAQNRRAYENRRRFEEGKVVDWRPRANKPQDARLPRGGASQQDPAGENAVAGRRAGGAFHRCEVCGATEISDPRLEFRYCSKCVGDHEFCMEHLAAHVHER